MAELLRSRGRGLAPGVLSSLALTAVLTLLMLPLRAHLGAATSGLVLVIPVVCAVSLGGWVAGLA
ncbi:MAG: hypothetical protein ABSF27_06305, partial [Candidatus Dormibacteria bacterium]